MSRRDAELEVRVEELDRRERELASKEARLRFRQRTLPPLNRSTSRRSHASYVEDDSEGIPPPPYVLRSVLRQPSYYSVTNRRRRSRSNASHRGIPQDPTYYDRYRPGIPTRSPESTDGSTNATGDDFAALQQIRNVTDLKASAILPSVAAVIEVCTKVSRTLYLKIDALGNRGRRRTHQIQTTAAELSSLALTLESLYNVLQDRSRLMSPAAYENTNNILLFCKKALLKIKDVISTSRRTRSNFFRRDLLDSSLGKARSVRHNLECLKTSLAAMTSTIMLASRMADGSTAKNMASTQIVFSNGGGNQHADGVSEIYELDTPINTLTAKLENDILANSLAIARWQQAERADYDLLYAHGIDSPTIGPDSPASNWVAGLVPPLALYGNDRRLTAPSISRALTDGAQLSEASTSQIELEEAEEEVRIASIVKLLLGKWTQRPQSDSTGTISSFREANIESPDHDMVGRTSSSTGETEHAHDSGAEPGSEPQSGYTANGNPEQSSDDADVEISHGSLHPNSAKTADVDKDEDEGDATIHLGRGRATTQHVNFHEPRVEDGHDSASEGTLSVLSSRPVFSTPRPSDSDGIDELEKLPKAGWEQGQLEELYDLIDREYAGSVTEEDVPSQARNIAYTIENEQYLYEPRLVDRSRHVDRSTSATRSIGFAETIIESSSDAPRRSSWRSRSRGRSRPRRYYRDSRSGSRESAIEYADGVNFDERGHIRFSQAGSLRSSSASRTLMGEEDKVEGGHADGSSNREDDDHLLSRHQTPSQAVHEDVSSDQPFPVRGKTRIPKRIVRIEVLHDMGYPWHEEGEMIIIEKALSKELIDEVIERSRGYQEVEEGEKKKVHENTSTYGPAVEIVDTTQTPKIQETKVVGITTSALEPLESDYSPDKADREEANHYNERALERAYMGESLHAATYRVEFLDVPPGTTKITFDMSSQTRHIAWDGPPLPDWEVFNIPQQTVQVTMNSIGGAMQKITWQKYSGMRRCKFYPEGDIESNVGSDQVVSSSSTERPSRRHAEDVSAKRDWEVVDVLALGSFVFALSIGLVSR